VPVALTMLNVSVSIPVVVGVKVTETTQLASEAKDPVQLAPKLVVKLLVAFEIDVSATAANPVFVIVTFWGDDVLPEIVPG
jgi:hypothetical protein